MTKQDFDFVQEQLFKLKPLQEKWLLELKIELSALKLSDHAKNPFIINYTIKDSLLRDLAAYYLRKYKYDCTIIKHRRYSNYLIECITVYKEVSYDLVLKYYAQSQIGHNVTTIADFKTEIENFVKFLKKEL